jgi:hypothetical protein
MHWSVAFPANIRPAVIRLGCTSLRSIPFESDSSLNAIKSSTGVGNFPYARPPIKIALAILSISSAHSRGGSIIFSWISSG